LSYLANTETNRQTKSGKNITSLAEVMISETEVSRFVLTHYTFYFSSPQEPHDQLKASE